MAFKYKLQAGRGACKAEVQDREVKQREWQEQRLRGGTGQVSTGCWEKTRAAVV